ncbi:hypothetical protein GT037_003560 [Alternaria burnsii]|uniref:Uncharacterized protein n=1 Tax=Alternaria burnsii TaxID=1187904 RepID=A0A8H7B6N6_9PLEO|nr:uncharacterized protein GT037_003560 [Alternaria burnsii]KAF7678179.1 hypothetical protein GT037_003560 [Alternaria burnsii]
MTVRSLRELLHATCIIIIVFAELGENNGKNPPATQEPREDAMIGAMDAFSSLCHHRVAPN